MPFDLSHRPLRSRHAKAPTGSSGTACRKWRAGPRVVIDTTLGQVEAILGAAWAPVTVRNFLDYVDRRLFDDLSFYRAVLHDDPATVPIACIQGGFGKAQRLIPPIPHESTAITGLRHGNGTLTMARNATGTAQAEFCICIGANPGLDAGGRRNPDGAGFAAFGQVIRGMAVVERIHRRPRFSHPARTDFLKQPVLIRTIRRAPL